MILFVFHECGPRYFSAKKEFYLSAAQNIWKLFLHWLLSLYVIMDSSLIFFFKMQILILCTFISYLFSVTSFHFTDTVSNTISPILLTHHPFPIPMLCWGLCLFMCTYSHQRSLFLLFLPLTIECHRTILLPIWCKSWFNLSESWWWALTPSFF